MYCKPKGPNPNRFRLTAIVTINDSFSQTALPKQQNLQWQLQQWQLPNGTPRLDYTVSQLLESSFCCDVIWSVHHFKFVQQHTVKLDNGRDPRLRCCVQVVIVTVQYNGVGTTVWYRYDVCVIRIRYNTVPAIYCGKDLWLNFFRARFTHVTSKVIDWVIDQWVFKIAYERKRTTHCNRIKALCAGIPFVYSVLSQRKRHQ